MRYWDNTGRYEVEANELQTLIPAMGQCATHKGELWRATTKIYWDYYNNGFGNNWEAPAAFLMDHVELPVAVQRMLCECARGNMGNDLYDVEIEQMVDTVIEFLRDKEDWPNNKDMWTWPVSYRYRFVDAYYEEDYDYDYSDVED
jgi:hypothetical protein